MTYLPESLFQPDSYINSANKISQRYEVYQVSKYGLFTVNSIKLDVIHLHTLLYISVSRLPSNFIVNITVSSHLFEITCSVALSFLKTISCWEWQYGVAVTSLLHDSLNRHALSSYNTDQCTQRYLDENLHTGNTKLMKILAIAM